MIVVCRMLPPLLVPSFDMRQLYAQDGTLNCVHAAVPADFFVMVSSRTAVITQVPHVLSQIRVARSHEARIAIRTQVLSGIKTESRSCAQRSGAPVSPFCSDGLRRVFDDGQMKLVSDLLQCIHVSALAVKMHGQQSSNFVRASGAETSLNQLRIQIQGVRIDIDEHRPRPRAYNCTCRSEETESGCDDGVAGADSRCHQGKPQRVRT